MATLNIDTSEFENLLLIALFNFVLNPEEIQNETLKNFVSKNGNKIKPSLIKSYLDSDQKARFNFKRISGIFDGSDKDVQNIRIGPSEKIEKEEKKEGIIKKVIKKILKKEEISKNDINTLNELINI
jgi:hypothetical protein